MESFKELQSLLTLLTGASPSVVFAVLWWLERKERINLYDKLLKTMDSMNQTNEAWMRILPKPGHSNNRIRRTGSETRDND